MKRLLKRLIHVGVVVGRIFVVGRARRCIVCWTGSSQCRRSCSACRLKCPMPREYSSASHRPTWKSAQSRLRNFCFYQMANKLEFEMISNCLCFWLIHLFIRPLVNSSTMSTILFPFGTWCGSISFFLIRSRIEFMHSFFIIKIKHYNYF